MSGRDTVQLSSLWRNKALEVGSADTVVGWGYKNLIKGCKWVIGNIFLMQVCYHCLRYHYLYLSQLFIYLFIYLLLIDHHLTTIDTPRGKSKLPWGSMAECKIGGEDGNIKWRIKPNAYSVLVRVCLRVYVCLTSSHATTSLNLSFFFPTSD